MAQEIKNNGGKMNIQNLAVGNFFSYYIVHPFHETLKPLDKLIATVASGILLTLGLGLVHAVCMIRYRAHIFSKVPPQSRVPVPTPPINPPPQAVNPLTPPISKTVSKLESMIETLKNGDATQQKKAQLYELGLKLHGGALSEPQTFRLNQGDLRDNYLQDSYHANSPQVLSDRGFYDYNPSTGAHEDVWVDFANSSLGGGCFTYGFVQEEIMVAETPDFANYIASHQSSTKRGWCDISIRNGDIGTRMNVGQGTPNPLLLRGLHRVQEIDTNQAYGKKFESITDIQRIVRPLPQPQKYDVLAIAAPRLTSTQPSEQHAPATVKDIFDTLMAGFTLVKNQSTPGMTPMIHTGKLGCGVFHNDPKLVIMLQMLAASHLDLDIKFWGTSPQEITQAQQTMNGLNLYGKSLQQCLDEIARSL